MIVLALRNVLRNPRRSLLTLLAILIGILSSNLLASLMRGLSSQLIDNAIYTFTGHAQVHALNFMSDPVIEHRFVVSPEQIRAIQNHPAVQALATRVRVPAVLMSERESVGVTLLGIDPEQERNLSFIGEGVSEGEMLASVDAPGIVIGRALAEQLQTRIGKRIVVMSQGIDGAIADQGFRVIGIYTAELAATEKGFAFIGRIKAQRMLGLRVGDDSEITELSVRGADRDELEAIQQLLQTHFPGLDVQSWRTLEPLVTALVKVQTGFLYIWFGIVITTISFGLINSMFMSVYERAREFGLYQALGMKPSQIRLQVLCESVFLLSLGVVLGQAATALSLLVLADGVDLSAFARGTAMFGARSVVHLHLKFGDALVATSSALLVGSLASLYPAWRASRMEAAQAMAQ